MSEGVRRRRVSGGVPRSASSTNAIVRRTTMPADCYERLVAGPRDRIRRSAGSRADESFRPGLQI
jgi:hypothetical protein